MHRIFLRCCDDEEMLSHPEYLAKVFIESTRSLALRTAGEEPFSLRLHIPAKHELILMASAEGAGFAV